MRNIILFDDEKREDLLPLTYTRPAAELRVGILTIAEKWARHLNGTVSYITQDYLADKYPLAIAEDNWVINGTVLPTYPLVHLIQELDSNEALMYDGELLAARLSEEQFFHLTHNEELEELNGFELEATPVMSLRYPWDIFRLNDEALRADFELLTRGRTSAPLSATNRVKGAEHVFLEAGAEVEYATLNAETGPIYIGKQSKVLEGCMVRGGLAMCEGAVLKMGAKIYGATTLGPYSKVGGEVNNCVLQGYSNKGHDGFLGNSVIGEWCNLGADTNNSNLKNDYGEVRVWNYPSQRFMKTGLQFCGLIMGDHSKSGINTMFNTGTVVGVSCNIFGGGFPRNFIPSFSWGGSSGFQTYRFEKAIQVAPRMMERRDVAFTPLEESILKAVFDQSAAHRRWD